MNYKFSAVLLLMLISSQIHADALDSVLIDAKNNGTKLLPEIQGMKGVNALFGSVVVKDGNYLAVGSPGALDNGGVTIYVKDNGQWVFSQNLDAVQFLGVEGFGNAIGMDGNKMVIAASKSDIGSSNSGAVLYYELINNKWIYVRTVRANSPTPGMEYGHSVSVHGNKVAVSTSSQSGLGNVFVYDVSNSNWVINDQFPNADHPWSLDSIDIYTAMNENHLVIGKTGDGSVVHIYRRVNNDWEFLQSLTPPEGSNLFGSALALENNRLIVGDWSKNQNAGEIYIYETNNNVWELKHTIVNQFPFSGERFGWSLSLLNEKLLVGAYGGNGEVSNSGSAYLLQLMNGAWANTQQVTALDGGNNDQFGYDLALTDQELIIGASRYDSDVPNSGQVYTYKRPGANWEQEQVLMLESPAFETYFSNGTAIGDDWLAIGASGDSDMGVNSGAVYLYEKLNGRLTFSAKIYADDAESDLYFGHKIVIEDDTMFISAPGSLSKEGFVYYYQKQSGVWVYQNKFKSVETSSSDQFGYEMSLENGLLAVSAPEQPFNTAQGGIYMFGLSGGVWSQIASITPNPAGTVLRFGVSLSMSGNQIAIGTQGHGSAYIFRFQNNLWTEVYQLSQPGLNDPNSFGDVVKLHGEHLVIGSTTEPQTFVYRFNGNNLGQPYVLDDAATFPDTSFDVDGNVLLTTHRDNGQSTLSGAKVYLLVDDEWVLTQRISAFNGVDLLYNDVDVYNGEAVIGNLNDSSRGVKNGAAYFYPYVGDLIYRNGFDPVF